MWTCRRLRGELKKAELTADIGTRQQVIPEVHALFQAVRAVTGLERVSYRKIVKAVTKSRRAEVYRKELQDALKVLSEITERVEKHYFDSDAVRERWRQNGALLNRPDVGEAEAETHQ